MTPSLTSRSGKLFWRTLLVGLLSFPAALVSQQSLTPTRSDVERTFEAAMAAEDRGDLAQAEALLSALHNERPGTFAVDESLGMVLVARSEVSRALPLLEAAVREQPSSDAAHVNLGAAFYKLNRAESALAEFERAVSINPGNLSAQQSIGRICMETHRTAQSAVAFVAAQRLKPDDPDLKLDCVTALLAAGRIGEAKTMLNTFVAPDGSARAQSLLGEVAEKEKRFQDAGSHFARALALEPSEENAWQLGDDLLQHWAFDAAVIEFRAASEKFPNSERLRLGLGAAYFGDSKYEEAIPVFADLLAVEPGNTWYAELLGMACTAPLQASSPRCAALVSFAQAHPRNAKAATNAASFLMKHDNDQQNVNLARNLLQRALATDPNLPEAQFEMAAVLQDSEDWKGSIPYLERALKLKPDFSEAHYRLARAYWRTGRRQDGDTQMALQRKSAHQNEVELDQRLRQVTSLAVTVQQ